MGKVTFLLDAIDAMAAGPKKDDIAAWDGWEFFVRSKEYVFACVLFRRQYIPPLCSTCQDIAVVVRCPAQGMTKDSCEVRDSK